MGQTISKCTCWRKEFLHNLHCNKSILRVLKRLLSAGENTNRSLDPIWSTNYSNSFNQRRQCGTNSGNKDMSNSRKCSQTACCRRKNAIWLPAIHFRQNWDLSWTEDERRISSWFMHCINTWLGFRFRICSQNTQTWEHNTSSEILWTAVIVSLHTVGLLSCFLPPHLSI